MSEPPFIPPSLSPRARHAALSYGQAFHRARSVHYAHRAQAAQALAAARAMLTATEVAIVDMMAARGASLNGIARQTRRGAEDLWRLYAGACDKLAAHFGAGDHAAGGAASVLQRLAQGAGQGVDGEGLADHPHARPPEGAALGGVGGITGDEQHG